VSITSSWKGGSAPKEGPSSEESSVSDSSMASSYKEDSPSARDSVSDISMGSPYRDGSTSIDCSASNMCACEDGSDVFTSEKPVSVISMSIPCVIKVF
jgi:hypothetical protein